MLDRRTTFALVSFLCLTGAAQAGWEPSSYYGEADTAVRGCAEKYTDDTWMCVVVRCERGQLKLYADYGEGNLGTPVAVTIGKATFAMRAGESGDAPYSESLLGDVDGLLAAIKAGRSMTLRPAGHELGAGYDKISLAGAAKAVSGLEKACR